MVLLLNLLLLSLGFLNPARANYIRDVTSDDYRMEDLSGGPDDGGGGFDDLNGGPDDGGGGFNE